MSKKDKRPLSFPRNGAITYAGDAEMLIATLLAAGGFLFAFDHATIAGKLVLSLLAVVSIFSWSIMITKLRVIRFARQQNARFLRGISTRSATAAFV